MTKNKKKKNKRKLPTKIGLKFDDNKTRVDLIPWEALDEIGKVLKFGASKYGESNWKNGIKTNRLLGAAIRHIYQFKDVEDLDQESQTLHIANACANLMFAIWMIKNKPEFDNRKK